MYNKKISVIVPVYNVEKYLEQCLDSIINQTFKDIEIICVNDGSTDNSLDILEKYAKSDSRIKIISQENKGLSGARNTGMKNSNGDYIYFIDSDDYLDLDALNQLYSLANEKSLDLILFKLFNFNDSDGKKFNQPYFDMEYLKNLSGKIFDYNSIKDDIFRLNETVYSKFFKRSLIENSTFKEGLIFEDTLFLMDYIFDAKRIYFYDEYLYYRRIRDDSIIQSASKKHADVIIIFDEITKKIKQYGFYDYYINLLFNRKVSNIYNRYVQVKTEFKEYFFDKFKEDCMTYKDEYCLMLDVNKINPRTKFIYDTMLKSNSYIELDLSMKLYDLNNDFNNIKKTKHDLENQIILLNEKESHLNSELSSLKNKNKKLNKKLKKVKSENKLMKKELKSANKLNESILNSKSWKITEPLRKLRNLK